MILAFSQVLPPFVVRESQVGPFGGSCPAGGVAAPGFCSELLPASAARLCCSVMARPSYSLGCAALPPLLLLFLRLFSRWLLRPRLPVERSRGVDDARGRFRGAA